MANKLKKTNVVVVGLGAAGGLAALPLSMAGLDVVGIEAGSWLGIQDFPPDELKNWTRNWPQSVQKTANEIPTYRLSEASHTEPRGSIPPMINGVGGTSLHYWAQSFRLNPWDFKVVSETTERYGVSRIPKGTTVEDWPLDYLELEPFYERVEIEVGVSGKAGNVKGKIDKQGNIFEGPRAKEYPMAPLRSTDYFDKLTASARKLKRNPYPGPAAINSKPYEDRGSCMYHGFCSRGGCPVNAKNSTAVSTIPKAIRTGHFTAITQARVTKVELDEKSGRATGVTFMRGGQEFFQEADVVLLASHVFEVSRLLLVSTSGAFPKGLANNHGQVGRHYFTHADQGPVSALFPYDINNWYGLPAQGVAVDDFADDNFDHSNLDFIGGGMLFAQARTLPLFYLAMNNFNRAPNWGSKWKMFFAENANRRASAYIQCTTLPSDKTYLDLDPTVKDPFGMPVIRITGSYLENDRKVNAFAKDKMEKWFLEAGAIAVVKTPLSNMQVNIGTTHHYGGTRMGKNPETNVCNAWGMTHEVPNLGILGGSVMGTSGSRNPTLTLQAFAWRTSDHIIKNWKTIVPANQSI